MRFASALALVVLAGCAEPTALLVFIDSDLPLTRVTVTVTGTDGVVAADSTSMDFATADRPLRLSLVPDASHAIGDDLEIEVKGYVDPAPGEVIDLTRVTRFVEGETRSLQMYLFEVCAGFECTEAGTTCVADERSTAGDCESEQLAAERYREDPPPIGATTPPVCGADCWHECVGDSPICESPVALALGGAHGCARTEEGHVFCWGQNDGGQLGHTSTSGRPALVPDLGGVTTVAAGDRHTCASTATGRAVCWGRGVEAQLGRGVEPDGSPVPVEPEGLDASHQVDRIDARGNSTCLILRTSGGPLEVRCFGENRHASAGVASGLVDSPSTPVPDVNDALGVGVGSDHACAMTDEGALNEVVCWGWARSGRLGDANLDDLDETTGQPVVIDVGVDLEGVTQLAVGEESSCALVDDGDTRRLRCWGPNEDRELGHGAAEPPFAPAALATAGPTDAGGAELTGWESVAMGLRQGCGVLDGAVWCWGWGNDGALGVGVDVHVSPTAVTDPARDGVATHVALGGRRDPIDPTRSITHACAILAGAIHCWGDNASGQLGLPAAGARVTTPRRLGS